MIFGRVLDPSNAPVSGATVVVLNTDTNTATRLATNETGYYEASFLLAGNYQVVAESAGFKKSVRGGIVLPVGVRLEINPLLELGDVTDTVSVTAEAPILETSTASWGRNLDNRSVMDLPVIGNNTMVLVKMTPGIQTSGVNDYLGPHSNSGASDYSTAGNVGGNEWSIDGAANNGASRKSAYLPVSDTVQEMRVETANFDASIGHTTGISVSMMTKAGTNSLHGTLTEIHWQQRWRAAPFFTRQLYYRNIAAAEAAGNTAQAEQLRSENITAPGRSNNYAGTVGGPVVLPKIFNGKDRLFFFFSYQGNKDYLQDLPSRLNRTIPTLDDRRGDFSRLLKVNASLYQIYDPLSVRPDPARPTHYIRDPIPGNVLPASRIVNPAAKFFTGILPIPNNDPDPAMEPANNYIAVDMPLLRDYKAYTNRIDYRYSDRHKFFGRWSWNDWINDSGDWTYSTFRGLQTGGPSTRTNLGATADWVYTISSSAVLEAAVSVNNYREGPRPVIPLQFKPSDVGLPAYMDAKAGDRHHLPQMSVAGYESMGRGSYPAYTRYRSASGRGELSLIRGSHTIRAGADMRGQFRTGGGGGNTSGNFSFSNVYTRAGDDNFRPAGTLGHSWAAFLMGLPDSATVATTDSYAMLNPYYGAFVQNSWRVTRSLTFNLGLRMEYEVGATERYNRVIGYFDPNAKPPTADIAQAAYARTPVPELPASQFTVKGGSLYPGTGGLTRRLWQSELMWLPRVAAAYQVNSRTVLRAGYGLFYDTLNVLNMGPNQLGFSRTTSTVITNDFGVTWQAGNPRAGISPMSDPFPLRADGTRFDEPLRDALGLMAVAGRSWTFTDFNLKHARQQRWRIGLQRQLSTNMMIDVAYSGSYSDRVPLAKNLSPLPEQYWASGMVRNDAIATNLNSNVTNPFRLANFAALAASNPLIYRDMGTQSFFTSSTIRKNQLLRPYPQMSGLTSEMAPLGEVRTDALEIAFERRFSKGLSLNAGYTRLRDRAAEFFADEFDPLPSWRESDEGRPHRFTATGLYEIPFGRGRALARSGVPGAVLGGFQVGLTYEWQPGPLLSWGNLFYYGDLADIGSGTRTLDRWFNLANFERTASKTPAAFHRRVFPTRVDGLRRDMTNQWNGNIQREFKVRERIALQFRADVINIQNRSQFAAPNMTPTSTNFGKVTSEVAGTKRFLQIQGRLRF
ncbi:MAG: carboxypeptidase regulatory-like domain-containing protein [Bryobacteraceae bacterium]